MNKLSIVVPCYNEEAAIPIFYEETKKCLKQIVGKIVEQAEFIFVDDGSSDDTLSVLQKLSIQDECVHYISFSRNFGKEAALYAGLNKACGNYIAVLDVDLQDPPSLIQPMLETIINEKYDCAATRRVTRKGEPPIRSFFARNFYKIMASLSNVEVVDGARDFRVMTKKYRDAVLTLCERSRFSKGLFPWVGFKTKWFEYENIERCTGSTKWSFWKLFLYSIDGIVAFSTKPLSLASILGILEFIIASFMIVFLIIRKLIFGDPVAGWASTVCIVLFTTGLNLLTIGILGQYIAKIYVEVKQRPIFIISEEK
jgi:glycosyltransferase involved in cell wall biosynthesis